MIRSTEAAATSVSVCMRFFNPPFGSVRPEGLVGTFTRLRATPGAAVFTGAPGIITGVGFEIPPHQGDSDRAVKPPVPQQRQGPAPESVEFTDSDPAAKSGGNDGSGISSGSGDSEGTRVALADADLSGHSGHSGQCHNPAQVQVQPVSPAEQDRLLVQAVLNGDQMAFAELVARYQGAVYNLAYRMLGDPTEAEDATQEVFVRAWSQLRTFDPDRRFSTWLLSIASHYTIDMLRRRKPAAPLDEVALFKPDDAPEPDEVVLQNEQRDMVNRLLGTLPDRYRSVTVLRYYNGLSYDEIASVTGLSESAVKTQLHRARRMLAEKLVHEQGGQAPRGAHARPANSTHTGRTGDAKGGAE